MRKTIFFASLAVLPMALFQSAWAVTPNADEMSEARRCVSAIFKGVAVPVTLQPGLEVVSNFDRVQKHTRFGKPLNLAGTHYTRGLFCHASSKITVRLPAPGKSFQAMLGVDSNEQTAGGQGSVVFAILVDGKEVFRSAILKEGMLPVPVKIDLDSIKEGGVKEFVLEVRDAGDGISCDQADWADAKITLADGQSVWLDELPMAGGPTVVDADNPPFSFVYDGKPSSQFLGSWKVERASKRLDKQRTQHTLAYTDPKSGLIVRAVGIEYHDFPTVEWTLYFKNSGKAATPIIEKIQALDVRFTRGHYGEFLLHHAVGSPCRPDDYGPLETPLPPKTAKKIAAAGGRPTNSDMSYFNLESPTAEGVIVVVGWPGQWSSLWTRDDGLGLHVQAGQELTHLKLLPGEEIRSPLVVLQFWKGDWVRAQNIWRRWMVAHNIPKPGGKTPQPELFGCSSHLYREMYDANEANQKMCIDRYLEERIPIGYWWMDAGWYPCDPVGWPKTGTWEVDSKRFPRGLRAISDHAHSKNVKTILWFEPERVAVDSWLFNKRPQWLLSTGSGQKLLNLGNTEAREWLTGHVDKLMTDQGIDLYRQDFNIDPLAFWRGVDAPDRQGITEIRYVEGYLAYWDELLRRHPDMFIDSCASGGRRNDLETMRRAIPLWRTDYRCEPVGTQCCTYGVSLWLPLSGTGAQDVDTYVFRSNMAPFTNCLLDIRNKKLDYDLLRKLVGQWRKVAKHYLGDYYPLTYYNTGKDTWMAWQFDTPETGEGIVQAFRRDKCIFECGRVKLFGLDPESTYEVTDLDRGKPRQISGRELLEKGLLVIITDQPGSAIITYKRNPGRNP